MLKIVVMAALPQEYAAFRKITGRWLLIEKKPFRKLSCFLHDREIVLIETGMGVHFAVDALLSVLASRPDLVIFSGFAGGLHPDLAVADVCVAKIAILLESAGENTRGRAFELRSPPELGAFFASRNVHPVTVVTVSEPPDKKALGAWISGGLAVVDMETAQLAGIASRERIAFLCLRAVSDAIDDELGFDLSAITGKGGKVNALKVLWTIIRSPSVLKAFHRSWLRSRRAGKSLGAVLADLVKIPANDLYGIAGGIEIVGRPEKGE